jgi:hypothetical protein
MKQSTCIRSLDVPQADSLPLIRKAVEAVNDGNEGVNAISRCTGFSERHVRYRLQAARILGILREDLSISPQGNRLLQSTPGSGQEMEIFRQCVRASKIMASLAPALLDNEQLEVTAVSKRIQALSGLSAATADRRAVVLRAWHRQLAVTCPAEKESA